MNAVPFDTLTMADKRENAGFSAQQATGAVADALHEAELATKGDVERSGAAFRAEMAVLRADMGRFRSEQRGAIELLRRDMTIRLGTMMVAGFGVMLAAMRYMQLHP